MSPDLSSMVWGISRSLRARASLNSPVLAWTPIFLHSLCTHRAAVNRMSVSPQIHMLKPLIPRAMVWRWGLWEVMRPRGRGLQEGDERPGKERHGRSRPKGIHGQARKWALARNQISRHLDLGFLCLQNGEKRISVMYTPGTMLVTAAGLAETPARRARV